jgi:hypothetical protein
MANNSNSSLQAFNHSNSNNLDTNSETGNLKSIEPGSAVFFFSFHHRAEAYV